MELKLYHGQLCPIIHVKDAVDKETRERISQEILDYKAQTDMTLPSNNDNCWRAPLQMKQDIYTPGLSEQSIEFIQNTVQTSVGNMLDVIVAHPNNNENTQKEIIEDYLGPVDFWGWVNVNEKGGDNTFHAHATSWMSGVMYFQTEGTGSIFFRSLETQYSITPYNWPYHNDLQFTPEDGDMLLFPSYLSHWVEANPIEKPRINMAWNINFELK